MASLCGHYYRESSKSCGLHSHFTQFNKKPGEDSTLRRLRIVLEILLCDLDDEAEISGESYGKDVVLDGYTIEQWREWGKRKSEIVSSTCRLNGELKALVTSLEADLTVLRSNC